MSCAGRKIALCQMGERSVDLGQSALLAEVFTDAAQVDVSVIDDNGAGVAFWEALARSRPRLRRSPMAWRARSR